MGVLELEEERRSVEERLSPEQLQLFEKENGDLMRMYEDQLDQIRYRPFPPLFLPFFLRLSQSLTAVLRSYFDCI